jgi:branched-chain amino acid transport system substrate-binding protein
MAQDPFADPPVQLAETLLGNLGIRTVYSNVFQENPNASSYKPIAQQVAQSGAQVVVLGSTDVPTVSEFMQVFAQEHYTPKMFIAAAGPDQGGAFISAVGQNNATGMMVPDGWYPGFPNQASQQMVSEYVKQYGGPRSGVNSDVAEAYSVGQILAQAVTTTGGTDNAQIIAYLHSGVTLNSVQGKVTFDALGENGSAAAFVFQWNNGAFNQVLPLGAQGSEGIIATKPAWSGTGTGTGTTPPPTG